MHIFKLLALVLVMATLGACAGMPISAYSRDGRSAYGVQVGGGQRRPPPGYYNRGYRPRPPYLRIGAVLGIGVRPMHGYRHPLPPYRQVDGRCRRGQDGFWYRQVPVNGRLETEECPPPPEDRYYRGW